MTRPLGFPEASLGLTDRLFSSGHAGFAVQIRQLWSGNATEFGEPRKTEVELGC